MKVVESELPPGANPAVGRPAGTVLPSALHAKPEAEPEPEPEPGPLLRRVVLLDADAVFRARVREYLLRDREYRYVFVEAEHGAHGLALCRGQGRFPDCLVLERRLPDMDGLEVLRELCSGGDEESATLSFPVIVLTGEEDEKPAVRHKALSLGVQDYLGKSFVSAESLGRAVVNAIDLFQLLQKQRQREVELRQKELAERTALFDTLTETAPIGLGFADCDFRMVRANAMLAMMSGIPAESFPGRHVKDIVPHLWPQLEPLYKQARAGHPVVNFVASGETPANPGQRRDYLSSHYPVRLDSRILGIGVIILDITEQKRTEALLQEAARRKDEFLAMLAHELRNPLAPIRNAVYILSRTGPLEPSLMRAREMIDRQVTHMVRLVDDLLDVSRISRGKIQIKKTPLDLHTVIKHAVDTSRPLIESRGHELLLQLPGEPVRIEGDLTRLAQVISNLLNNAAKYTDRGGKISLVVKKAAQGDCEEAIISVRDTGRGIDPGVLESVFDLFYQADLSLDRSEGGLGIGLSLVKSLVELHGGQVSAHSEGLGKGSEFVIRLPCIKRREEEGEGVAARRADTPSAPLPTASAVHRVLIVDDNRDAAESLATLLGLDHHEILVAHDGQRAVEMALAERPTAVLLDIGLPCLDGFRACRAMRAGGLKTAFIVAVSGYGQDVDRQRAQEAGFDDYLVKPVSPTTLRALLLSRRAAE